MSLFDKIGSLREDASQPENRMSADRLRRYKSVFEQDADRLAQCCPPTLTGYRDAALFYTT